jgi:hypothetical protein
VVTPVPPSKRRLLWWVHAALALALAAACMPASAVLPTGSQPPAPSVTALAPTHAPATLTAAPTHTATTPATATETATPTEPAATFTPAPPATEPIVALAAAGDLMLARSIGDRIVSDGPEVVFAGVQPALDVADIFVANLECVISDQGTPALKSFAFQAPPEAAAALSAGGVDLVALANNHSLDYGVEALADMLPRLRALGIETVGAGADGEAARAPVILERNGLRVAFLGYVDVPIEGRTGFDTRSWEAGPDQPGLAWADPAQMQFDIASARLKADVVVVVMHFGLEGRRDVTDEQQALARGAIDAGAALVLGAHAHVLQPVEAYNDGLIVYGLGNFVFDGFAPPSTYSALFTARLSRAGVVDYAWVPVMVDHGLPRLATAAEAAVIQDMVAPLE